MNNYALVTGASSGIGFQYARVLAQQGYKLIIVSNEEAIHNKADELRQEFPSIEVIPLVSNLGVESAAKALYDYCTQHAYTVEVLVNNAGVYHDKDFIDDSEGFNQLILMLHVYTPAMLCYYFGKEMASRRCGYILNMCSVTSAMPVQRMSTYGATKAFFSHFTRSIHIELRSKGVKVTNISPGAVDTGLYNINAGMTKFGKAIGFIVDPYKLAKRAVKACQRGRAKITVPGAWVIVAGLVRIIPTSLMRLVRRLNWF